MTKSKGTGRGGIRQGAGRRPRVATIDWNAVGRAYFTGTESLDGILASFGLSHGDLLAHAAQNHWLMRRPTKPHPDDVGDLASALAMEMFSVEGVANRAPRFVAAMVALGAREIDIAEALGIGLPALKAEFSRELNFRSSDPQRGTGVRT
jgi:hypothetical protein